MGGPNPGICWAEGELTEEHGGHQEAVISYMIHIPSFLDFLPI